MHELVPELLKNIVFVMKTTGVLLPRHQREVEWLNAKQIVPAPCSESYSTSIMCLLRISCASCFKFQGRQQATF
ncbi:conserved hypothetical protein [Ricinus communis]|uniref:Uncharacterized protein n=1 Tax=Ricinus communis TaxID=3988 RepID=B9SVJ3_RICCO|nr:conserved hypothetical protein [Ricinus communis]